MNDGINRRELTFKAMAGLVGGALGWLPVEITSHGHSLTEVQTTSSVVANFVAMALLSGLIGGMVMAGEAQTLELTADVKRRFLRGAAVCFALSLPATYYSNIAFTFILQAGGWGVNQQGSMAMLILARLVGWTMMGALLGAGVGLSSLSLPNIVKGAIGGWVGGFVGGLFFDAISANMGGLLSRLIGLSAIGLAVGLFIGLVQELTKSAWVKVEAGRLRGREYRLERAASHLGRAEESEVGLFGDPAIVARHAVIERKGEQFMVRDLSHREGTFLNGNRIESAELHEGDRIRIGSYEVSFHVRKSGAILGPLRLGEGLRREHIPAPMPVPSSDTPSLIDREGRRYGLRPGGALNIGRATDNDLVLEHASVSRHHATITARNGGFALKDLGSQNGTFVGGQRIAEAQLANGDTIRLGDAEFTVRL